jgi:multidrug resistance efflux pump
MTSLPFRLPTMVWRPLRYTWVLGLGLLVVSVAGTGWMLNTHTQAADKSPKNGTESGISQLMVVCTGFVDVPGGIRQLYPMLAQPNHVREVKAHESESVTKDAVLLIMDDTLAQENLKRATADLKAAETQLEQAKQGPAKHELDIKSQERAISAKKYQLEAARKNADRAKRMREKQLGSAEEADAAELLAKSLEDAVAVEELKLEELNLLDPNKDVLRAQQQVEDKKAVRDSAQYLLGLCELKAPVDGAVMRVNVNPGDLLGPQPHQPAVLFCPATPRIIRAEVQQEFADRVSVGASAAIQDESNSAGTWRGKVTRLADFYIQRRPIVQQDQPFQLNDVRTREFIVELDPGQPPLSINQRMRVTLGHP